MEIMASGVNKKIQNRQVLSDISFKLHNSECVGLVGPNGAGKTTLIRCILGLYSFEGKITFDEKDVKTIDMCDNDVFFMLDNYGLFKDLTVRENLEFFYKSYNDSKINRDEMNKKIDNILISINLFNRSKDSIKSLSSGMKQRLSCGRTMVSTPKAMILDEPFSALDVEGQFFLMDYINDLKSKGTTVLISSHDLGHLQKMCDSILFIKDGKILRKTSMSEIDTVESAYRDLIMNEGK